MRPWKGDHYKGFLQVPSNFLVNNQLHVRATQERQPAGLLVLALQLFGGALQGGTHHDPGLQVPPLLQG